MNPEVEMFILNVELRNVGQQLDKTRLILLIDQASALLQEQKDVLVVDPATAEPTKNKT